VEHLNRGPEALEWLRSNANESGLASNRFGPTAEAIKFVEKLYAAGAVHVRVFQDAIRDDPETIRLEGGSYADSLVVTLPENPAKRQAVSAICEKEIVEEGFDPSESIGDKTVFLWWD